MRRARVASLGSLVATVVSAVVLVIEYPRILAIALAAVCVTIVIVIKHRPNIARLRLGREPRIRFGARSATASATGPSGRGG
jgi:glycerol-3-phosphate acyltransferase PlsY